MEFKRVKQPAYSHVNGTWERKDWVHDAEGFMPHHLRVGAGEICQLLRKSICYKYVVFKTYIYIWYKIHLLSKLTRKYVYNIKIHQI